MNSKILPLVIIFLIINALLIFLALKQNSPLPKTVPSQQANLISFPTNPSDTGVSEISLYYSFDGIISKLKPTGSNIMLELNPSSPDYPSFNLNKGTVIVMNQNQKASPVSTNDLLVGQHITLNASYDIKRKNWVVASVFIHNK